MEPGSKRAERPAVATVVNVRPRRLLGIGFVAHLGALPPRPAPCRRRHGTVSTQMAGVDVVGRRRPRGARTDVAVLQGGVPTRAEGRTKLGRVACQPVSTGLTGVDIVGTRGPLGAGTDIAALRGGVPARGEGRSGQVARQVALAGGSPQIAVGVRLNHGQELRSTTRFQNVGANTESPGEVSAPGSGVTQPPLPAGIAHRSGDSCERAQDANIR
eukprot:CAMPEP_0170206990 /NCGR_PEP_ID=MMETSP0116_2-20130129/3065_1 /TAXON_ID=400756 /ORGANISM="Durinskia baltica, Strain CSIRO CS-38" /LENGTH=214 /DNA_ID=CAMNT_0010457433 /DNA_START=469 /DNA_END=1110 /DNA_ORIENTATION=-